MKTLREARSKYLGQLAVITKAPRDRLKWDTVRSAMGKVELNIDDARHREMFLTRMNLVSYMKDPSSMPITMRAKLILIKQTDLTAREFGNVMENRPTSSSGSISDTHLSKWQPVYNSLVESIKRIKGNISEYFRVLDKSKVLEDHHRELSMTINLPIDKDTYNYLKYDYEIQMNRKKSASKPNESGPSLKGKGAVQKTKIKQENVMFNSQNFINKMFRKVDGVSWDLTTGNIGVKTDEGLMSLKLTYEELAEGSKDAPKLLRASTTVNQFEQMGMPIPAFAQDTPKDKIGVGDLIYKGGQAFGWITEKVDDHSFMIITPTGTRTEWSPADVTMGFTSGIMVLKNLTSMIGGAGMSNMSNMLMPMMMMGQFDGQNEGGLDKMIPFMLMQNSGMMGGQGSQENPMMNMMMMSMMMGGKGNNPFS